MNIATKHEPARLSLAPGVLPSAWADRAALLIGAALLVRLLVASTTGTVGYRGVLRAVGARSRAQLLRPSAAGRVDDVARAARSARRRGPCDSAPSSTARRSAALLYRLGARLFSPRAGFLAVAMVTAIPAFVFVGFLLNPEGLLAPLWILLLLLLDDLREHDEPWRPLLLGRRHRRRVPREVHGAARRAGRARSTWRARRSTRRWLRRPSFYLAGVLALVIATPVVAWNYAHDWPSLRLHLSERMVRPPG